MDDADRMARNEITRLMESGNAVALMEAWSTAPSWDYTDRIIDHVAEHGLTATTAQEFARQLQDEAGK